MVSKPDFEYVLLRPVRISLPESNGNLDISGQRTPDALCRPQTPQIIGQFDVARLQAYFKPYVNLREMSKPPGAEELVVPVALAEPMQAIANYHFSRDPDRYRDSALLTELQMYSLDPGHYGHAGAPHLDINVERFMRQEGSLRSYSLFYTALPPYHFPQANLHTAQLVRQAQAQGQTQIYEDFNELILDYACNTAPVTYSSGLIVEHGDASIHSSGKTEAACDRIWGCAELTQDRWQLDEMDAEWRRRRSNLGFSSAERPS